MKHIQIDLAWQFISIGKSKVETVATNRGDL